MRSPTSSNARRNMAGKRRPLRHDFEQLLLQNYGVLIVGIIAFSALIPFTTAGLPGRSIFNIEHTHQQLMYRFFLPEAAGVTCIAASLFGLALGLLLFRFVLDKRQSATFFSLGLSRPALFGVRFGMGCLFLLIGIGLPMLVSLLLNIAALGATVGLYSYFFTTLCGLLLTGLVSFALCAICTSLSGTVVEALLFTVALMLLPSILLLGVGELMKKLLWGNAFGALPYSGTAAIEAGLFERFSFLNPLRFFWRDAETFSAYARAHDLREPLAPPWLLLLGWVVAAAVLILLARWALKKRRAEQAGISGLCPALGAVSSFALCFALSVAALAFVADYSVPAALAAALVVFLCCFAFLQATLFRRQLERRTLITSLVVELAATGCVVALIAGGGLGYAGRVPAAAEVESVSLSYVGSPSYLGDDVSGARSGTGYYVTSADSYTNPDEVAQVLAIHQSLGTLGRRPLASAEPVLDTVLPYDIELRYTLQNGRQLVRYYDRASLAIFSEMLALDDSLPVRTRIENTLLGGSAEVSGGISAAGCYRNGDIYFADPFYSRPVLVEMTEDQRSRLLQALAADLAAQSVADRYFPAEAPVGVLLFSMDGANDSQSFAYSLGNTLVYLTPAFGETLALIEEYELSYLFEWEGEVESITLQRYDPYNSSFNQRTTPLSNYFLGYRADAGNFLVQKDFGKQRALTDPATIEALLPGLRGCYFMNDGGYLAMVQLAGEENCVYLYLPGDQLPEGLEVG